MADNTPTNGEINVISQKILENPLKTSVTIFLAAIITAVGASYTTTKGIAANEVREVAPIAVRVAGENIFATKENNAEIWRYLSDRRSERDKQMDRLVTSDKFEERTNAINQRLERIEQSQQQILDRLPR